MARVPTAALVASLVSLGCGGDAADVATTPPVAPPVASSDVLLERDGALEANDVRGTISFLDRYDVAVAAGEHVRVTLTSSAFDPVLEVTPPRGAPLTNDDVGGDRTRSELELTAPIAGQLKVQVTSFTQGASGAYHLRVERVPGRAPTPVVVAPSRQHHVLGAIGSAPGAAIRVGDRTTGALAAGDPTLGSGELADVYLLDVASPTDLTIQMESTAVDSFLVVTGPADGSWENDDSGGSRDATVSIPAASPGQYRIVATSYRAGEVGSYELKVLAAREQTPLAAGAGEEQIVAGDLGDGDRQLASGELYDEHDFDWPVGTAIRVEARSTDVDTYLILRTPSGHQTDNDDQTPGVTNAALDFVVQEQGPHRLLLTTYRPGERGHYELAIRGGRPPQVATGEPVVPAAGGADPTRIDNARAFRPRTGATGATGATGGSARGRPPRGGRRGAAGSTGPTSIAGSLAAGDATLRSGELMDTHPMTFTPGSPVSIRLESTAFDPYLIVRSPSGRQQDNDDLQPGNLSAGIDIPAAEAGEYQILVTSYRPGETGAYTLRTSTGTASPATVPPAVGLPQLPPGTLPPGTQPPGTQPPGTQPPGITPPTARPPGTGGSQVWVLSVGISDYPGSGNDLPECANDAVKIAEALRNQGLTAPEREFLLTDAQATTGAIRTALQRIVADAQPADTFVFFYSGHGGQTTGRSADTRELDGIDEYLFVYDGQLMDDEIGRLFDRIRARTSIAAIDACFAGGFSKDLVTRAGVVGMFSSEEDVTSGVASQFQAGGYLSHFLRLAIQGEADADPRDRVMTVGELTHYVWQQYGRQASDVRMSMGYQHLVVDRGAVHTSQELWRH
jgi:hypothetical protein